MRLLLSTFRLIDRAGSETYLLTVAEQLVRLGHEVIVHSIDDAEHSVLAAERGLRVRRRGARAAGPRSTRCSCRTRS